MNLNIFGSTGNIGTKSLKLLKIYRSNIKVNLLTANSNYKKLIAQTNIYNPKFISINDESKINYIKKNINKNINVLNRNELLSYLSHSKSDLTILAISGFKALNYLDFIIKNTKNIGLVNKECIVSAGHILNSLIKKNNCNIFPLDSEHFSINNLIGKFNKNDLSKVYLTASGGPFYNLKSNEFKNASFKRATNHPKWKMGYKNSIDSATLANKCLELIEAHYLFNLNFNKLDILIHPEAKIHSVIEFNNYTSQMSYFYPDMAIPIINFFSIFDTKFIFYSKVINRYKFQKNINFTLNSVNFKNYPIYKIFYNLDKSKPINLIKFNLSNEYAVELFKKNIIKFGDIHKIIDKSLSIPNLNLPINSIKNILNFHYYFENLLYKKIYEV